MIGKEIATLQATAVKEFQESQGLEADGKIGPETLAAIDTALAAL